MKNFTSNKYSSRRRSPQKDEYILAYVCGCFAIIYLIILLVMNFTLIKKFDGRDQVYNSLRKITEGKQDIVNGLVEEFGAIQMSEEKDFIDSKLDKGIELSKQMKTLNVNKPKSLIVQNIENGITRPGIIVLGMHRSGTSMLGGLLAKALGYNVGPNNTLIGAHFDNQKGFFERLNVVLQNDEFMRKQRVDYANNVINYDHEKALKMKNSGQLNFGQGNKLLSFYNNPDNSPWMQKDPRMCITLKTWLPLLNGSPAILFSFRNPLEVAKSMEKRDGSTVFPITRGLRLWIVYNMRAIQNSAHLCRVITSNEALMTDTMNELKSIGEGLRKCGVPPPTNASKSIVETFVDPSMHLDTTKYLKTDKIIDQHGDCIVYDYVSSGDSAHAHQPLELNLYKVSMKIFCDLKSGAAYKPDYVWPKLPH